MILYVLRLVWCGVVCREQQCNICELEMRRFRGLCCCVDDVSRGVALFEYPLAVDAWVDLF